MPKPLRRVSNVASRNGHVSREEMRRRLQWLFSKIERVPQEWDFKARERGGQGQLGLISLASVQPRKFEWLWPNRIPLRGPTVFAGEGDVGKTFVAIDLATRVSTGTAFPDGAPCERGSTLFFSAEDDAETVLRPRFDAAGADCTRIYIQGPDAELTLTLGDKNGRGLDALEKAVESYRGQIRLIIFDPMTAFMGGKDINRDDEVRSVFRRLTQIAQKHSLAIVCIMHFGKSTEVKAKYRSLGSVGFVNAARAAWAIGREYDDDSIAHFLQTKKNYAKRIPGLTYSLRSVGETCKVSWGEESHLDPEKLGRGTRDEKHAKVLEWIGRFCVKNKADSVTDANLQQSGLPGTRCDADYCRGLLRQLEQSGHGRVETTGRKSIRFVPSKKQKRSLIR